MGLLIVGHDVRVVALKSTFRRTVPFEEFSLVDGIDQSRFVDVAPILVTNNASLHDLNSKLDDPIPMNRFRPNVVIEGLAGLCRRHSEHCNTANSN